MLMIATPSSETQGSSEEKFAWNLSCKLRRSQGQGIFDRAAERHALTKTTHFDAMIALTMQFILE